MASWVSRQENPNMQKALSDWSIVLQYDDKVKHRLISGKFSDIKFFLPSRVRLYPFDKPIKSLCFRSFVLSVLVAPFHLKVISKIALLGTISDLFVCLVPVRPFISGMAVLSHVDDMLQEPLSPYNRKVTYT